MKMLLGIVLDLLPVAVAVLIRPGLLGAGLGFLIALGYWFVQMRSSTRRAKTVTAVNVLYLGVSWGAMWLAPNLQMAQHAQLAVYLILTISTWLSLKFGEPFTMPYAKETVPPSLWENPLFVRINRQLSQLWGALFTLSLLFASLAELHLLSGPWAYVLTNGWSVLGVLGMMVLPERMQFYYLKRMQPSAPPEPAWQSIYAQKWLTDPHQYDVIVVGAGLGGLATALEAARQRAKVLVLEQHHMAGGACTTYERQGFRFDAGVESVSGLGPLGPVRHFLQRHGLDGAVTWLRNTYAIRTPGLEMTIPQDFDAWREELIRRFPAEAEGLRGLFAEIAAMYREKSTVFAPDRVVPNVPRTPQALLAFAQSNPHYVRWRGQTWGEFLGHFVSHPDLHRSLSMLTGYVGSDGPNTGVDIMTSLMGYFIDGGYWPQGGSGALAQGMVERLREYGGEIRLSSRVFRVLVEGGRVRGVVSKTGTDSSAVVVSDVDPRVTYETLVGLEQLGDEDRRQVEALRPSLSLFVWNAALRVPFPRRELLHWQFAEPKALPEWGLTFSSAGVHSAAAMDPAMAPEGQGTVTINLPTQAEAGRLSSLSKVDYQRLKRDIDRLCRALLRELSPEAADGVLFSEVGTPKTVARYLNTYEGSIYSIRRQSESDFPGMKSPLPGLFHTGAGVGYGPGVEAVIITGTAVAEKLDLPVRAKPTARAESVVEQTSSL